ncbi:MAG: haloacid dehalogenase type II [Rubrivivax sp.]|jgi:2-haloacid dehalogenase|nr:haloacid dehalogenase type II [Rubrivivax sp.]
MRPYRALLFDVFGTVVDWFGSVSAELRASGLALDPVAFTQAWRRGYGPAMQQVRSGELPWTNIDGLHRRILDGLLAENGLVPGRDLSEAQAADLNRAWHRLAPWPDSVDGITRLKRRFVVAPLSNGNVSLLVDLARHGGLPWDAIFSAELFGHYKPDPETYLGACRLLGLQPAQVLMVAAHPSDLRGAAAAGLATAYVPRPAEQGPGGMMEPWTAGEFDLVAHDFIDLASQLGA